MDATRVSSTWWQMYETLQDESVLEDVEIYENVVRKLNLRVIYC